MTPISEIAKVVKNAIFLPFVSDNKFKMINPMNDPIGETDWIIIRDDSF